MDWITLIGAILGSSAISTLITAAVNRRRSRAEAHKVESDIEETYSDRLERRISTLERRLDRFELRDAILTSATACAHKCEVDDALCPVLSYLGSNPLPSKTDQQCS